LKDNKIKVFIAFFVVGLFNNGGYVMVGAAASDLAKEFHHEDLMPMFQLYYLSSNSYLYII